MSDRRAKPDDCAAVLPVESDKAGDRSRIRSDPALTRKGWVRRNVADRERADEAARIYRSLGYEVRAEKLKPEHFSADCNGCSSLACRSYVMIYTRPREKDSGQT